MSEPRTIDLDVLLADRGIDVAVYEGLKADAEAAADQAQAAVAVLDNLKANVPATLGTAGALANPGGNNITGGTYVFGDKPIAAGALASVAAWFRNTSGTLKLVKFTKAGNTYTVTGKETIAIPATGVATVVSAMTFDGTEYLGYYVVGGPIGWVAGAITGTGSLYGGAADLNVAGSFSNPTANAANQVHQIKLNLLVPQQTVTAAAFAAVQADLATASALASAAPADTEGVRSGLEAMFDQPNLNPDPDLQLLGVAGSGIWIGVNKPTAAISRGRRAFTYQNGENGELNIPVAALGGPGATFSMSLTVESVTRASGSILGWIKYLNAAGAEISHTTIFTLTATSANELAIVAAGQVIPALTASVSLFVTSAAAGNAITLSRVMIARGSKAVFRPTLWLPKRRRVWIATNGSDYGEGTEAAPFATPARALQFLRDPDFLSSGEIVYKEGDYAGHHFPLGPIQSGWAGAIGELTVRSRCAGQRVRLIHGTALTGISKTAGLTYVYQCAMALAVSPSAATGAAKFIFEDGTPESAIAIADRRPHHLGRSHRSPSFRMRRAASTAACDATPGSWFYNAATTTLYFHPPASDDPTANGKTYRVPSALNANGNGLGVSGFGAIGDASYFASIAGGRPGRLRVEGIDVFYAARGFDMRGLISSELHDCEAVGSRLHGHYSGYGTFAETRNFRAIASGQDNFGGGVDPGSYASFDRVWKSVHTTPYAALTGDDNISGHSRHYLEVRDGLFERGDDSGAAIVMGCEALFTGCEFLDNYLDPDPAGTGANGEGLGVRQAPAGAEGGANSVARAINCTARRNRYNFSVIGGGNSLVLDGPLAIDASTYEYYAGNAGDYLEVTSRGPNVYANASAAKRKYVAAGATLADPFGVLA